MVEVKVLDLLDLTMVVEVRVVGANGSGVSKVVVEVRVLDY